MTRAFEFGTPGQIDITQPNPAGERIIFRSTDASDTNVNVTTTGDVSGTATSSVDPTNTANGKIEVSPNESWETLSQFLLASPLAGDLYVYGQGTAAEGQVHVVSIPADGETLRVTLNGPTTPTYTFRNPARATILCLAASTLNQGDYLDVVVTGGSGAGTYRFWFDIDAAGTGAPSDPGTLVEVDVLSGDTAAQVATKLQTAMSSGLNTVAAVGISTATVSVTRVKLGVMSVTDGAAATGFTFTAVAAGTADAANQIRTGWAPDGTAYDVNLMADTIAWGITVITGGAAGEDFGTANTPNPYVDATSSSSAVHFTDFLAINRLLGWDIQQTSGSSLSIIPMVGGVNGATLAQIPAGQTSLVDFFTLETQDLGDNVLPALFTGPSNAINIGSGEIEIHVKIANVGSAVQWRLEWTDDPSLGAWAICSETSPVISSNNHPTTAPQITKITSVKPEHIRLVITANANATASAADFRVNYPT